MGPSQPKFWDHSGIRLGSSWNQFGQKLLGDSYNDISKTRLRQFGGTSGHWAGYCNPLQDQDFNNWPIKKIDLDPFLFRAKEILKLEDNFFNEKFSQNLNLFNVIYSSNPRLGDRFYSHLKKSKYIYLSLNTIFLNFNGKNGKIESINCFKTFAFASVVLIRLCKINEEDIFASIDFL